MCPVNDVNELCTRESNKKRKVQNAAKRYNANGKALHVSANKSCWFYMACPRYKTSYATGVEKQACEMNVAASDRPHSVVLCDLSGYLIQMKAPHVRI